MIPHALIAALGAFALLCQTLLFRDFLTAFEGNELAVGIFFSTWFLWIAVGAWSAWHFEKVSRWLPLLILLYLPAFTAEHYLILAARTIGNVASYEVFPYRRMIFVAVFTNAPVSFATGFFFPLACRWWEELQNQRKPKTNRLAAGQAYVLETFGAIAGGLLVTALLSCGMPAMSVFLAGAFILTLCAAFASQKPWRIGLAAATLAAMLFMGAGRIWNDFDAHRAWNRVLPAGDYRGSFVTPQGEYLYGESSGQFTILSGGHISGVLPGAEHAAEVAALAMSQQPTAARALIIGNSGLAIGAQLAKFPQIQSMAWIHPDPEYPKCLRRVLPDKLRKSLENITLPNGDARTYLASQNGKFDIIILDLSEPDTLSINRFFTQEFFAQVKDALSENGAAALRITGAANYLGGELAYLGASAVTTFGQVFPHTALKPGDETWLFGAKQDVLSKSAKQLEERFTSIPGAAEVYPPEALPALYPADRIAFQRERYQKILERSGHEALLNSDDHPKALFYTLLVALRQAGVKGMAEHLRPNLTALLWALLGLPVFYLIMRILFHMRARAPIPPENVDVISRRAVTPFDTGFVLFSAGFAGIASSMILLFGYQSQFGSLYLHLGLLSALFMAGSFLGGAAAERLASRAQLPKAWAALFVTAHLAFLTGIAFNVAWLRWQYGVLFAVCGAFTGAYFPWGARQLKDAKFPVLRAGASLENWDHIGAAVGSTIAGLILLPLFGSRICAYGVMLLLAVNLPLVFISLQRTVSLNKTDRLWRGAAYFMAGAALWMLSVSYVTEWLHRGAQRELLAQHAAAIAGTATLEQKEEALNAGAISYFVAENTETHETLYIFDSSTLADGITGYGGPIRLAIAITSEGVLRDVHVMENHETPSYLAMIAPWLDRLKSRDVLDDRLASVDAVSGATITSKAILCTIQSASQTFASQVLGREVTRTAPASTENTLSANFLVLVMFMILAPLMRIRPSRWPRRAFLLASFLMLGVYFNLQYSTQHIFVLLSGYLPPVACSVSFLLIILIPIYVAFFGNIYCGYLCPFGALQELAGDFVPQTKSIEPSKETWRYARTLKCVLLFFLIALFSLTRDLSVLSADPLTTIFGAARGKYILIFSVVLVTLSIPYRRFWCRNLCPAGAFLAWFGALRIVRFLGPKSLPGRCDLGVRNLNELDCIRCDRCRHAKE